MKRFLALDSCRGICACLVALLHFRANSHIQDLPFFLNAYLFVDFFFVLSGFVIAASYERRINEGFGVAKFMVLRFGRLYPLHFVMLMAFVGFEVLNFAFDGILGGKTGGTFTGKRAPETIITNLFLVHSLGFFEPGAWNAPSWSISTEFYTYLIFAITLLVFRNKLTFVMIVTVIISPVAIGVLSPTNMETTTSYGIIRSLFGFAGGVLVWRAYQMWHQWIIEQLEDSPIIFNLAEIIVVVAVIVFVTEADNGILSLFAPFIFSTAVFVFAFELGQVSRVLTLKPMVLLGALSYSIYMVHFFVSARLWNVAQALEKFLDFKLITNEMRIGTQMWEGDFYYVIYLLMVIVTSYVTFHIIEKPARIWSRKLVYKS